MPKFRKKPVVISAWSASDLLYKSERDWMGLPVEIVSQYENGNIIFAPSQIEIITLEGTLCAHGTDMVICGVAGEIYPCKSEIFEATYEAVTT